MPKMSKLSKMPKITVSLRSLFLSTSDVYVWEIIKLA
jgi:hypothetical protein